MHSAEVQAWLLDQASRLGLETTHLNAYLAEDFRVLTHGPIARLMQQAMSKYEAMGHEHLKRVAVEAFRALHDQERGKNELMVEEQKHRLPLLRNEVQESIVALLRSPEDGSSSEGGAFVGTQATTRGTDCFMASSTFQERASNVYREKSSALALFCRKLEDQHVHWKNTCDGLLLSHHQLLQTKGCATNTSQPQFQAAFKTLLHQALDFLDPEAQASSKRSQNSECSSSNLSGRSSSLSTSSSLEEMCRLRPSDSAGQNFQMRSILQQPLEEEAYLLFRGKTQEWIGTLTEDAEEGARRLSVAKADGAKKLQQLSLGTVNSAKVVYINRNAETKDMQLKAEGLQGKLSKLLCQRRVKVASAQAEESQQAPSLGPLRLKPLNVKPVTTAMASQSCTAGVAPKNNLPTCPPAEGFAAEPCASTTRRSVLSLLTRQRSSALPQQHFKALAANSTPLLLLEILSSQQQLAVRKAKALAKISACRRNEIQLQQMQQEGKILVGKAQRLQDQFRQLNVMSEAARVDNFSKAKVNHEYCKRLEVLSSVLHKEGHHASPLTPLRDCSRRVLQQLASVNGLLEQEIREALACQQAPAVPQALGIFREEVHPPCHYQESGKLASKCGGQVLAEPLCLELSGRGAAGDITALNPIYWWQGVEFLSQGVTGSGEQEDVDKEQLAFMAGIPGPLTAQALTAAAVLAQARSLGQSAGMPHSVTPLYSTQHNIIGVESYRDKCAVVLSQCSQACSGLEPAATSLAREVQVASGMLEGYHERAKQVVSRLQGISHSAEAIMVGEGTTVKGMMDEWERHPIAEALLGEQESQRRGISGKGTTQWHCY